VPSDHQESEKAESDSEDESLRLMSEDNIIGEEVLVSVASREQDIEIEHGVKAATATGVAEMIHVSLSNKARTSESAECQVQVPETKSSGEGMLNNISAVDELVKKTSEGMFPPKLNDLVKETTAMDVNIEHIEETEVSMDIFFKPAADQAGEEPVQSAIETIILQLVSNDIDIADGECLSTPIGENDNLSDEEKVEASQNIDTMIAELQGIQPFLRRCAQ
jgi:hypothetical protein